MNIHEYINTAIAVVGVLGIYMKLRGITTNELHDLKVRMGRIEQRLSYIEGKLDIYNKSGKIST